MFEIPSDENIQKVTITKSVIKHEGEPVITRTKKPRIKKDTTN